MRKSIKLVVAFVVIAMVAVSCQKEGQFNPSKKIKKITSTCTGTKADGKIDTHILTREFVWSSKRLNSVNCYMDGEVVSTSKYNYDSKNRVGELNIYDYEENSSLKYKYEYDGNKLIAIKVIVDGSEYGTWEVEHSGNVITKISYKASENKGCNSFAPTADALFFLPDNVINDINISLKENSTKGLLGTTTTTLGFSWEGENLVGLSYSVGNIVHNVKFTYDNKKNPLYGWYDLVLNVESVMFSKHNITMAFDEMKKGNETQTEQRYYNYTYTGSYPATCEFPTEIEDEYDISVNATCKQTYEY